MSSLRARLLILWLLSLTAALVVGLLLERLYRESSAAQTGRANQALAQACDAIADRYAYYSAGWDGPARGQEDAALRDDLRNVVTAGLIGQTGVAGGIWQQGAGTLTAAPPAELAGAVDAVAGEAVASEATSRQRVSGTDTALLLACPLPGPLTGLAAWVLVRVPLAAGYFALRVGLGVLFALMLGMTVWIGWLLLVWSRRIAAMVAGLAAPEAAALPHLAPTGEAELDRIVTALNTASGRLAEARAQSAELAARVAVSERLAALGRVAAGVAHEIRNPIAAMRLKAENALEGDPARRGPALEAILAQIARLDRLSGELLSMTQRRAPAPEPADIAGLLAASAAEHRDLAACTLRVDCPDMTARLDPAMTRRALDNLVQNAIRHTPPGGTVTLAGRRAGGVLRLSVRDTGPGVAEPVRDTLTEPFVTTRADGTGLGLAIAREMVEAQGGRLVVDDHGGDGQGAAFTLEIPWPAS